MMMGILMAGVITINTVAKREESPRSQVPIIDEIKDPWGGGIGQ